MTRSKQIYLRALESEDLAYLYEWENDCSIWRVSGTVAPFSRYTLKCYIENSGGDIFQSGQLRMMIIQKEGDVPIGTVDLFDIDALNRRAGVGILIYSSEDRGRGYASEALELMVNHSFLSLGLHQLYANIMSDNSASVELFCRHGFSLVGIKRDWLFMDGRWHDEQLYQRIR